MRLQKVTAMPDHGDSFLPRIQSVFYAVFDDLQGPKIVYQVPEGLIAVSSSGPSNSISNGPSTVSTPYTDTSPVIPYHGSTSTTEITSSCNSNSSLSSPNGYKTASRHFQSTSPVKRSNSSQLTLFKFVDISMFVIPSPELCGRLVTCSTQRHRIIGFPVQLKGKYERNFFRYNLCFVFERDADLSCYEPIVRKVSRVLKSCEEESAFLSSPETSPTVHAILEQLYEDLNSYSETSIPIDQFNSIELKIFPFYPNPPPLDDWAVPLALINLGKRIEDNWDITMRKVCKHINGVNHVSRIAHLADCDIALTRQAVSHLLYYQVIMMIDIFQYSNMYTLRKSIQWLADESHVREECGPYVTKKGRNIPDWPKLLHLYSRLRPGKSLYDWMKEFDVEALGIDVRRFTSFGVIKGFLRRVHRYPVFIPPDPSEQIDMTYDLASATNPSSDLTQGRKRGMSTSNINTRTSPYALTEDTALVQSSTRVYSQSAVFPAIASETMVHGMIESPLQTVQPAISASHRARRASAAEKVLEQIRNREKSSASALPSPRHSWINFQHDNAGPTIGNVGSATLNGNGINTSGLQHTSQASPTKGAINGKIEPVRRHSLITPIVPPSSPVTAKVTLSSSRTNRTSRSPSTPHFVQSGHAQTSSASTIPLGLQGLLDGEHHTDELSIRFEAGWPLLEQWLLTIGGGSGDGDYGNVVILYK